MSVIARKTSTKLICAAPSYLAARGEPRTPVELCEHACLGFTGFASYPDWRLRDAAGKRHSVRVDGPLIADDAEALVAAAVHGLGIMISTEWLVSRELAEGRLVPILRDWCAAQRPTVDRS